MRIAITATGSTLEAEVDPRFGRCQYFIIVDPETLDFEAVENASASAPGGAGVSTGQMIAGKGVAAVLTGNCGPNAYQVLSAVGVQVITGVSGKIKDNIEEYKLGTFAAAKKPNVADHFGMSYGGSTSGSTAPGANIGGGIGIGQGMGRGMGKGRGMGMGYGMGGGVSPLSSPSPQPLDLQQEIDILKSQSRVMVQQLAEIQRQIDELVKKQK